MFSQCSHVKILETAGSFKFHLNPTGPICTYVYLCMIYERQRGKLPLDPHWKNNTYKLQRFINLVMQGNGVNAILLFSDGDHPPVVSTAIPGMDTTLNPAEDFPDIDRYDLGEKGWSKSKLAIV